MITIQLTPEEIARSEAYAVAVTKKESAANSRNNLRGDNGAPRYYHALAGKMAEFAGARLIGGEVDCNIYDQGNQEIASFPPDILVHRYRQRAFVKCCRHPYVTPLYRGGVAIHETGDCETSFLIDFQDRLALSPNPDAVVLLMAVQERRGLVHPLGMLDATLVPSLLREPRADQIIGKKHAMYWSHFSQNNGFVDATGWDAWRETSLLTDGGPVSQEPDARRPGVRLLH